MVSDARFGEPFETEDMKTMRINGELEAEVFLVDNLSLSAPTAWRTRASSPRVDDKSTGFSTVGDNFTSLGFHVSVRRRPLIG